jgi:hypothetical protein
MDAIEQYKHAEQMEWRERTMTHWLQHVEDDTGDLVDVLHFCDRECATGAASVDVDAETLAGVDVDAVSKRTGDPLGGLWLGTYETDAMTFCAGCAMPLWYGLEDARSVREQLTDSVAFARTFADEFTEDGEAWIDVRVQLFNGDCLIWTGDPSFDTDHRGAWGAGSIDVLVGGEREIVNVTHDLLTEALDALAQPNYSSFRPSIGRSWVPHLPKRLSMRMSQCRMRTRSRSR